MCVCVFFMQFGVFNKLIGWDFLCLLVSWLVWYSMNDRIYELGSLSPFVLVFAGHVALYCKIRKP